MTILEMFEREDIYSILEKTLTEYYKVVKQKSVTVNVSKKHFFKRYVIYPRLGIIVPLFPKWSVMKRTYVSLDVQGNLPKKLFAWAYITLCFLTFGILADASLELSDKSVFGRSMVIIPSNRKIRIYDYNKGYVDSILKDGFNDYYFNNELLARKDSKYDFILGVLDSGERWYREKLLNGRCLVRCAKEDYNKFLGRVMEDLGLFYKSQSRTIESSVYADELYNSYSKLITDIEERKHIMCGEKLRRILNESAEILRSATAEIPLVLSHGDLQTGNIYVDEEQNKVYIIDWETFKMRSAWYDACTVLFSTRRKNNFSDLINSIHSNEIESLFFFDSEKNRDRKFVAATLVLEEMGFFLEEIIDLPNEMGAEIIERFEYEIDRIDWVKVYG